MRKYLDLLCEVHDKGIVKDNRTGTPSRSVFGRQLRFDLREGFPLLTTKKVFFKSIVHELLWFLNGDTNTNYLNENGVHIWDEWADELGDLGPVYGQQWRSWSNAPDIDQLEILINNLSIFPFSRRHIISSWNPSVLPDESVSPQENVALGKMALAPCHCLFQFNVEPIPDEERNNMPGFPEYYLSCQLYQRSADIFLGVPFNIASYSLLTMMIAQQVNMIPKDFVHTFGDLHLYENHSTQAITQINRTPTRLPEVILNPSKDGICDYTEEDILLIGYDPAPAIKAPIAI